MVFHAEKFIALARYDWPNRPGSFDWDEISDYYNTIEAAQKVIDRSKKLDGDLYSAYRVDRVVFDTVWSSEDE